jgi:hypothetical protein
MVDIHAARAATRRCCLDALRASPTPSSTAWLHLRLACVLDALKFPLFLHVLELRLVAVHLVQLNQAGALQIDATEDVFLHGRSRLSLFFAAPTKLWWLRPHTRLPGELVHLSNLSMVSLPFSVPLPALTAISFRRWSPTPRASSAGILFMAPLASGQAHLVHRFPCFYSRVLVRLHLVYLELNLAAAHLRPCSSTSMMPSTTLTSARVHQTMCPYPKSDASPGRHPLDAACSPIRSRLCSSEPSSTTSFFFSFVRLRSFFYLPLKFQFPHILKHL